MTLSTILTRAAMLATVAPFVFMLVEAGQDWLAAYAAQNTPRETRIKSELISQLTEEELISLDRTAMKQEAVLDLLNGRDKFDQTIERFRTLNQSQTNPSLQLMAPADEFQDGTISQIFSYARIQLLTEPSFVPRLTLDELRCECEYAQSLTD